MMKKKMNYMYLGTPLNVKYKRSGCSLPKTTKFCTQVTARELYLYHRDCSTYSDHTPQGHAVSYIGRHSVQINFVYLSAGVSQGLCKFWQCDMAWGITTDHQTFSWLSMLLGL